MTYQQIFSQSNLEQLFRERLSAAVEEAKSSVLNPPNKAVNKDQICQNICKDFAVPPIEFLENEMTASGTKVTKNDRIEIEFRVPFVGDPLLILHQSEEIRFKKLPTVIYIPAPSVDGDAHHQEKQCISFSITDEHSINAEAFIGQAKLALGNLKNILETNNRLAHQLNKSQLPNAVENAFGFSLNALRKLEEVNSQLQNSQK